jgi:hypothetical protein
MSTTHLTDEQFMECVIDAPDAASHAHLAGCEQCREELALFSKSVSDFSLATLNWSEAQPSVSLRASARHRRPAFVAAGWALATAVVLAVALPAVWHRERPAAPASAAGVPVAAPVPAAREPITVASTEDSPAQIAEDNRMMQSVNLAIGVSEPSPIREYRLQAVHHTGARSRNQTRSE